MNINYIFNSEFKEQEFVKNTIKPNMLVFDIGAHYGKYTKLFSLLGCNVFAFEPVPGSFLKLKSLVESEKMSNVLLVNKAIYNIHNSTIMMNLFPEEVSSWNSIGKSPMGKDIVEQVNVPTITIDNFYKEMKLQNDIDYMKLDVEGSELFALQGMENLLEQKKIKYLQFEISELPLKGTGIKPKQIFDYLYSKDYRCYEILENGVIGNKIKNSNVFYDNYIAIPK